MRTILTCSVLFMILTTEGIAGGPVYSRFGFGDMVYFGSNRAYAMGIMGVAFTEDGFVNLYNPASLARLSFTRIGGGFEYRSSSLEDAGGSQRFATGGFQSLAIAIPASETHGIVIFGSTIPYSAVNYAVEVRDTIGGSSATQTLSGVGGLSTLSLGTSYRPSSDLALGFALNYHYGTIQRRSEIEFDDASFADNELRTSLFANGFSLTAGFTYEGLSSLFGSSALEPLTVGFVMTTASSLSMKEERMLLTERTADTALVRRGSGTLPLRWALGLAYTTPGIVISGDVAVQQWTAANFFDPPTVEIRNSLQAGMGIEFPSKQNPATYWDRVAYRAGFTYTSTYVGVNGRSVTGWFISGGIALPIGPDARMNLGLQAGSRGTLDGGLSKESFLRFSVSVDASEAWFITLEED